MATKTLRRAARATVAAIGVSTAIVAGTIVADVANAADIPQITDQYLFSTSLNSFQNLRVQKPYDGQLDWSSDGCSN